MTETPSLKRVLLGLLVAAGPVAFLVYQALPRYKHTGVLTVEGSTFEPTGCHALQGSRGIRLFDDRGAELTLAMPQVAIKIWAWVDGTPQVTFTARDGARVDLGSCGTLGLWGEGYHEPDRRAVSARVSLSCGPKTTGKLEVSGCF